MRKLKNKKDKVIEKKDYYNDIENRERVLKKAREILEDEKVFTLLNHIVVKSDDLQDELIYIIAGYLVSIDTLDKIKDRNKRTKEKINIKNNLTKFLYDVYDTMNPNVNTLIYTLLFELNEFLTLYCPNSINKFGIFARKQDTKNEYENLQNSFITIDNEPVKENFNKLLGYEVAFDKTIVAKFQTCFDWISKTLIRNKKYNSVIVTKEKLDKALNNGLEKISDELEEKKIFSDETMKIFPKEAILFEAFYSRIILIKKLLVSAERERFYKKHFQDISITEKKRDTAHLKNTITRLDNMLKDLYELIETGKITGKRILNVA